jgi:hypothetical protein
MRLRTSSPVSPRYRSQFVPGVPGSHMARVDASGLDRVAAPGTRSPRSDPSGGSRLQLTRFDTAIETAPLAPRVTAPTG